MLRDLGSQLLGVEEFRALYGLGGFGQVQIPTTLYMRCCIAGRPGYNMQDGFVEMLGRIEHDWCSDHGLSWLALLHLTRVFTRSACVYFSYSCFPLPV